ncbi:recombinase family protein [Cytobacillus oceanisediminis]|uniref:recombinase family protein n=1 Tax=Cytobacillus oceanisediminis TaxID=665099 RepID=UPI0023D9DB90|nr:recombinase family protein [Cytobacillus oceanisediminis]MDF2039861.1 recombinase family protein [Cytobacillus oceanisediminis]
MIKGYARVSTEHQNLNRQLKALKEAGAEYIYQEKVSGATSEREELQKMLEELNEGDTVIVSDLTRISRSTNDLFQLVELIKSKGASLKSIKDKWLDTSDDSAYSEFLFTVFAGISQLERNLIKERQAEGIAIAKQNGKYKGRVKKYHEKNDALNHAIELYLNRSENGLSATEIVKRTQISRSALYRGLKERGIN